jgi:hypothetical protein
MIVRKEANGDMLLIGQTDHSRLVGQFGAQWGNAQFATPRPYESVARAAAFHDFGWLRYETAPLWSEASGETPGFREIPATTAQLEGYAWCGDWLLAADPYAGLLVNMHRTGLWRNRYETITHPSMSIRSLGAPIEAFAAKAEAQQANAREAWDAQELWTNYRLLQVWDLLGLYFACQAPYDDHIEPVPVTYDDGKRDGVRMTLTPAGAGKVQFDPFPFAARPCAVQLSYRRLPQTRYPDSAAFRRAYYQAPLDVMKFELV